MNAFFYQAKLCCLSTNTYRKLLRARKNLSKQDYFWFIKLQIKENEARINNCFQLLPETVISGEKILADIYLAEIKFWQITCKYDFQEERYYLSLTKPPLVYRLEINQQLIALPTCVENWQAKEAKKQQIYQLEHGDLIRIQTKCLLFYCPQGINSVDKRVDKL